jgi:hypothetical protein
MLTANGGPRKCRDCLKIKRHSRAEIALIVTSSGWPNKTTQKSKYDLFAPGVGFACRVTNFAVVRAGYGISYFPYGSGLQPAGSILWFTRIRV